MYIKKFTFAVDKIRRNMLQYRAECINGMKKDLQVQDERIEVSV